MSELSVMAKTLAEADSTAAETARLRESEQQFRAVFEHALDAMLILDDAGRFVDANAAACDLFGVTRLIGSNVDEFRPAESSAEDARRRWAALKATTSTVTAGRIRRADGTERDVEFGWRASILPGRHLLVVRDVTERRRLEQQLLQSQKMETVGRLAGGIAHDFNNLLTAILGYCHLLRETTSGDVRRDIEEIRQAGERAASLTRELLAFSRKQVLKPRVVDLNTIVRGMEGMLGRVLGEDVELSVVLQPLEGLVKVDPTQLEQVILNLAVNARDAMPDGGTLTIATSRMHVDRDFASRHPTMTTGSHVVLRVSDTGVGIAPDVQPHIFEPFFTTKDRGRGTGLGLAMVYGIVKQSGGWIWVSSELHAGTTFTIYLPVTNEATGGEGVPERAPAGGHETVLLVEDEPTVGALARRVLESQGYRVLEASNGRDACVLAREYPGAIDLLLTDVIMPGMSGRELVAQLRPLRPAMKVLYMSGYTDNIVERHGLLAPGVMFFAKPFTPVGLANVVRQTLDTAVN